MTYWRPLPQTGPIRPREAVPIAGGWSWFTHAARLERGAAPQVVPAAEVPPAALARIAAPRADVAGLSMDRPRIMAILNATPDSFSDGGLYGDVATGRARARTLVAEGADILDVGGESTRPGARPVPAEEEARRVVPLVRAIAGDWAGAISVDTRKASVAAAAAAAGAGLLNDVSALTHDPGMAGVAAGTGLPVCLMHAQGDPQTMQAAPRYDDVLLDVYDHLEARIAAAEAAGIARARLVVDPGLGFGKTLEHNLALLAGLSLFHGLGCPILLGASRKRFVGTIGGAADPLDRMPGSVAVGLAGIGQGVQIIRVHDAGATRQAIALWRAAIEGDEP